MYGIETKNIHCHLIPTSLILLTVRGKATQTLPNKIITGTINKIDIKYEKISMKEFPVEIEYAYIRLWMKLPIPVKI